MIVFLRQNGLKHCDLSGGVGDQLLDKDLLHLSPGINSQALPTADRGGDVIGIGIRRDGNQIGIVAGIARLNGVYGLRHCRIARRVQLGIGSRARALTDNGVAVLLELGLLFRCG